MKIEEILLTGFRGTSSEMLVRKADSKYLILPNDKAKDAQMVLAEIDRKAYRYIFSFGQKPNIRDKVYIETAARNGSCCLHTDFAYGQLQDALSAEHITLRISDNAGTSFCNSLYWNVLDYLHSHRRNTKIIFLHIPYTKNMTAAEDFCERVHSGIEKFCLSERIIKPERRVSYGTIPYTARDGR